ncbi:histidine ABC transporter [Vibrio sp. JCM 19236]|nr:histidine ABC transporter [Vibrio sp. JCM 19236]
MDFSIIVDSLDIYIDGLYTTMWLVAAALVIGLAFAIPLAVARNSKNWLLMGPSWAFIYFFRGTPLLVQLYLIYYGMDQFIPVKDTLWENAWFCALVAFTLNTCAYTSEIIRGAINGLPKGEVEAAKAYGMSHLKRFIALLCRVRCVVHCQLTVTK